MNSRHRPGRTLFLTFIFSAYIAVLGALPVLSGAKVLAQQQQNASKQAGGANATAGASSSPGPTVSVQSPQPVFHEIDRNKDGIVDKSEAGMVPGLSAIFERADRNKDGKLDRAEFARGLAILDGHK